MKPTRATLQARAAAAHLQGELGKLADFILANMPGEPSPNEGAADTAIRLLAALPAVHKANEELLTRCKDLETRLDDASQACNDYVATIDEHTATIKQLRRTEADLGKVVSEQHELLGKLKAERDAARENASRSEQRREAAENDNNFLRDQLMGFTRQNADLAGQLAVLREFAPVSAQQQYRDRTPRLSGRLAGGGISAGEGEQATPWYHRRG